MNQKGFAHILLLVFVVTGLGAAGYWYLATQQTSQTHPSQTHTTNETTNWKTYTTSAYTFQYPPNFAVSASNGKVLVSNNYQITINTLAPGTAVVPNFQFSIETYNGSLEKITENISLNPENMSQTIGGKLFRTAFDGFEGTGDFNYYYEAKPSHWYVFKHLIQLDNSVQDDYKQDSRYLNTQQQKEIANQILSTFEFLGQDQVNNTPTPSQTTSNVPSSWKMWTFDIGDFTYKLPPDWLVKDGVNLYWHRDSAYEPHRGYWQKKLYEGGSRRQQYITRFDDYGECGQKLTNNTSVKEENINGLSVLKILPLNTEEACQVSPALIFVKGNYLYSLRVSHGEGGRLDFWNEPSYLNTYYLIISSIQ